MSDSDSPDDATETTANGTDTEDRFRDTSIDRRTFVRLSAATGAALAFPGNASASTASEKFDAEYEYVLNHTPTDHAVPSLVEFTDPAGFEAFETIADDPTTTTQSGNFAYAQLTASQASQAADLPTASSFQFSPGSNPFWRIGYYPLGVFPEAERSVDFIGFEQLKDGLGVLEDRYPGTVRVKQMAPDSIGAGLTPGHRNRVTTRDDRKEMLVAEVTNDDSDASFEEKEKVFFSCSLHGLERAGAEAGARIIENICRRDERAGEIPRLLDDVVVLFGFTNPDGWVARNPQYPTSYQFDIPDAPGVPLYERGNAEIYDTNRQYPSVGYITPAHYPGAPKALKEDTDRGRETIENNPDALSLVAHFRDYANLSYGADLHGGPVFNEFVLGLISQDQYDTREMHETYQMCQVIDDVLEEELTVWETAGDAKQAVLGDTDTGLLFGVLPEEAFDYATIYDTIGYTVSGAMLDWMSHPEELGGLGMTTLDFEMAFSHLLGGNVFNPALLDMEVRGYRTAIRTITEFAFENSDTPNSTDQFSTTTKTAFENDDGETIQAPQRVAYVTTGPIGTEEDALQRNSGDLDFDGDGTGGGSEPDSTTFSRSTVQETAAGSETVELSHTVEQSGLHSLSVHPHSHQAFLDLELLGPDGETVYEHEGVTEERAGGKCCGHPEWVVPQPESGTYTLRATNLADDPEPLEGQFGTLASPSGNPDPVSALGYGQYDYSVTPFQFFEDYDESIQDTGAVEPVTVEEVANGALDSYDQAIVPHDYGANADAGYIGDALDDGSTIGYAAPSHPTAGYDVDGYLDALDEFVTANGNLVLTDRGVALLPQLDNELVDGSQFSGVTTSYQEVAQFTDKNLDDRLLTDVRPIQQQLWKVAPLGYSVSGEAPIYTLAGGEFSSAAKQAATVAGQTDGEVAAGSILRREAGGTGVHVIGSLLPPSTQRNLHPFGLLDYGVTFLGYLLLTSALGFQQIRRTADNPEGEAFGAGPATPGPEPKPRFTAAGSRSDDGSVFTAGQTNQVDIAVDSLSHDATITDTVPGSWEVKENFGDVTAVEGAGDGDGEKTVVLGTVNASETKQGNDEESVTRTYFAEAPDSTGQYTFGPAVARAVDADAVKNATAQVAGTDTNTVGGVDTDV